MENVEPFADLRQEIDLNTFEIGTTCWVDVTHINTPYSFYVRPRTYNLFMGYVQARGKHVNVSEIGVGDIVIFSSEVLKTNVRGKILFKENGDEPLYTMHAIDIGCFEKSVPLSRIWRRQYRADLPSLVTHCQLADCAPRDLVWDNRAINAMKSSAEGERAKILIRNKTSDAVIVELYNSGYSDVSTVLALAGYTKFGFNCKHHFRQNPILDALPPRYTQKHLENKKVIHVRMQSGSMYDKFYVAPIDEYKIYLTDQKNFAAEVKALHVIDMADIYIDTPVAVYCEVSDKFERGIVKQIMWHASKAKVQLVDWGNEVVKPVYTLKPLPGNYLVFPPRAICCTMHKNQPFTDDLLHLANPGAEFQITIEEIGAHNSPHSVIISPLQK